MCMFWTKIFRYLYKCSDIRIQNGMICWCRLLPPASGCGARWRPFCAHLWWGEAGLPGFSRHPPQGAVAAMYVHIDLEDQYMTCRHGATYYLGTFPRVKRSRTQHTVTLRTSTRTFSSSSETLFTRTSDKNLSNQHNSSISFSLLIC